MIKTQWCTITVKFCRFLLFSTPEKKKISVSFICSSQWTKHFKGVEIVTSIYIATFRFSVKWRTAVEIRNLRLWWSVIRHTDTNSIAGQVKPNTMKIGNHKSKLSCLTFSINGAAISLPVRGGEGGRWIKRLLHCFLAKAYKNVITITTIRSLRFENQNNSEIIFFKTRFKMSEVQ